MSPPPDPERLIDADEAVPAALRRALGAARNVAPSRDAMAALAASLPLGIGPAGPGGAPGNGAPGAGGLHAGGASTAGAAGAAGGAHAVAGAVAATGSLALPSVLPGVIAGALLGLMTSGAWMAVTDSDPRPVSIPSVSVQSASPVRPSDSLPASSGTAAVAPMAPATTAAIPTATVLASATAELPESEADLLQRAHAQARTNPSAALALINEHAARFPGGPLQEESEVIAITALVSAGKLIEAHARADRFLAAFPRSAHRRRLDALFAAAAKKTAPTHQN